MEELNSLYQLIKSRNDFTVPIIRGVHLHSKFNPIKEASAFAQGFSKSIQLKKNILVFGLGYGYHIDALHVLASEHHKEFEIVVIEPNKSLINDFNKERPFQHSNIKIISEQNIDLLFEDKSFVSFLLKRPCIIKHDTSFNLQKQYYSKFLTYTSSNSIKDYSHLVEDQNFREYLKPYQDGTLQDLNDSILKVAKVNHLNDFAILAMSEIFNSTNSETRGQHD